VGVRAGVGVGPPPPPTLHQVGYAHAAPLPVPHVAPDPERADTAAAHLRATDALDALAARLLVGVLRDLGAVVAPGHRHDRRALADQVGVVPEHRALFDAALDLLAGAGMLRAADGYVEVTDRVRAGDVTTVVADPSRAVAALAGTHPGVAPAAELLGRCVRALSDVLTGRRDGMDVLFPEGSADLVSRFYRSDPVMEQYNRLLGEVLRTAAADGPVRILEVGAGTGATTRIVLAALAPFGARVHYTYTDLSSTFIRHGRREFGDRAGIEFRVLDIERPPAEQGFADDARYDVVLATNVLHATRRIESTLDHIKDLLVPGGLLVVNEGTGPAAYLTLIFGLTRGWWLAEDTALRLPPTPVLSAPRWLDALTVAGFTSAAELALPVEPADQRLLLGRADGLRVRRTGHAGPARTETAGASRPPTTAADTSRETTERQVSAVFARVLELPPDRLARDAVFGDYGVDSLVALELTRALEADFGPLPATLLFEHTTIGRLADHLHTLRGSREVDPDPSPAPSAEPSPTHPIPAQHRPTPSSDGPATRTAAPRPPARGSLRAVVAGLSDAEVDRMLTLLGGLATTTNAKGDSA
ncbi:methyltransferase, partial [Micromonospora sp. NPDC002296]|uniref:methyltransferase n=1 Tax=Micromonospora sp. NPDC002296 TaxID=3154271 RepID=UPI00332666BD